LCIFSHHDVRFARCYHLYFHTSLYSFGHHFTINNAGEKITTHYDDTLRGMVEHLKIALPYFIAPPYPVIAPHTYTTSLSNRYRIQYCVVRLCRFHFIFRRISVPHFTAHTVEF